MMTQFLCPSQEPLVPNVTTMTPTIGQSKQDEEMKALQSSIDAPNVKRRGEIMVDERIALNYRTDRFIALES